MTVENPLLGRGSNPCGPQNQPPAFGTFCQGDRWCAIGDSITQMGCYLSYIYLFYATRFPGHRFDMVNAGASYSTAAISIERLNADVLSHQPTLATIMFGMCDIWWEHRGRLSLNEYTTSLAVLVDRLRQNDCKIVLLTPTPYDQTHWNDDTKIDPMFCGLERYARAVQSLALQEGLLCIDMFRLITGNAR